ncbi:MAG: epoxyqueuosine reductase QueH [Butyrivibrio sp.]|nr:epoxyqueuosine reductase QueH [Butyrivibrio sp.]
MSSKGNYAKQLEQLIDDFKVRGEHPRILLHACCAPCSSYCLEYLREYFDITLFYYNPNITMADEYHKRVAEAERLIGEYNRQVEEQDFEGMNSDENARMIELLEGIYNPSDYINAIKGLESCPEGGERCTKCFELRLEESARIAKEKGYDYFTTTLTISPMKDADRLNLIGQKMGEKYGVKFLPSDFKKKNGYKRSIELSHKFGLYRQDFCGCAFSKAEREKQKQEKQLEEQLKQN